MIHSKCLLLLILLGVGNMVYGQNIVYDARDGDLAKVKESIENGVDINTKTSMYDETALMLAAKEGHLEIVKYLLANGALVNIQGKSSYAGFTALSWASSNGHIEIVKILVANNADLYLQCWNGYTALSWASSNGHIEIVKILVEAGTDINFIPDYGTSEYWRYNTPLMAASVKGQLEVIKYLLDMSVHGANRADINTKNGKGRTALWVASWRGQSETAQYLLKNGADATGMTIVDWAKSGLTYKVKESIIITFEDRWDNIPLMMDIKGEQFWDSMGFYLEDTNLERQLKKEERLKKAKYDVNFRDDSDVTALIAASSSGHLETVKYLLENGANPNLRSGVGETALGEASEKGYLEIVKLLIENGANPNLYWLSGYTTKMGAMMTAGSISMGFPEILSFDANANYPALITALFYGHLEIVKYLVENGADINAKSLLGTALVVASYQGELEIVKYLVENGANINRKGYDGKTALTVASEKGDSEIVRYLESILEIKKGNINAKDEYGDTALIRAVFDGDLNAIKYLVENGADINLRGQYGDTALIRALFYGDPEIVKYLVENGADINLRVKYGDTALIRASGEGHLEIVKYLVDAAVADTYSIQTYVNVQNDYGSTALMYASSAGGDLEIVKYLVEEKYVDVNVEDKEGSTALIIASQYGQLEIVKFLALNGADINHRNKDGRTALSIISGRLQFYLGVDKDNTGSPSHLKLSVSVEKEYKEIIQFLKDMSVASQM